MTSLGESGRVSLDIDGILGERFQVMQHNTHVRIITNVHRYVNCLPTTPNNKRKLLPACTHTYIQLVQALESRWKRSSVPSIRSPLVDEERMRPGHWLRPVLCVSFSALSLQEWQRVHKICASYHRRQSLWGTEARASSEFRARRHAMECASPELLQSNAVRPLLWQNCCTKCFLVN